MKEMINKLIKKHEDDQKIEKAKTEARHSALQLEIDEMVEILQYQNISISEMVEIQKKADAKREKIESMLEESQKERTKPTWRIGDLMWW